MKHKLTGLTAKSCISAEHSRDRSINGFLLNLMGVIAAYAFFPKKPILNLFSVFITLLFEILSQTAGRVIMVVAHSPI